MPKLLPGESPATKKARGAGGPSSGSGSAALKDGATNGDQAGEGAAEAKADGDGAKDKGTGGKGGKKGGGGGPQGQKEMMRMMMDMNKLLLSHDESIGALESMQLHTFIVPQQSPAMEAGKMEGQKYHEKVTNTPKDELKKMDLGPPHVYIALAVLKDFTHTHPAECDELRELQDFIKRLEEADWKEAVRIVPHFKIGKTYEENYKIRFSCRRLQDTSCLCSYLLKEGAEEKVGRAPRGKLARDCQKWLK
jgi:hypothetical protein